METATDPNSTPPRPNPRRKAWRIAFGVFGAVVVLDLVFILLVGGEDQDPFEDRRVAEAFLDGLVVGNGSVEDDPEGESGFARSWSLTSEGFRGESDLDQFLYAQEEVSEQRGFLDAWRREERERGDFRRRILEYRLVFSGTRGRPQYAGCRVAVVRAPEGYRVDEFTLFDLDESN